MKPLNLTLLAAFCFTLFGCGGGGYSRFADTGLKLCPREYKPIEKDLPVSDKVSKKSWPGEGDVDSSLNAGEYEYIAMEYYINDTGTNMQFYITESKDRAGNFAVTRVCSREILDLSSKVTLEFPSSFTIGSSGKITSQTKTLAIQHTDRIEVEVSEAQNQPQPPSKVTDEQNYESQLYQTKAEDGSIKYELRMQDESGPVKTYALIRYQKKSD